MTNLVRRDPFLLDLYDFRRDFDQIFNRILLISLSGKRISLPRRRSISSRPLRRISTKTQRSTSAACPCPASSPRMWKSTPWATC